MADADLLGVISDAHRNLQLYAEPIKRHEAYYNGARRLAALGMSIPPEMERLQTVVNWPRLAVDSIDERLVLQGFRTSSASALDGRTAQWIRSNHLPVLGSAAHIESMIQGVSYISVDWDGNPNHDPTILPEPAVNFWVTWDAKYQTILSAVRFWNDPMLQPTETLTPFHQKPAMGTVFEPNTATLLPPERGQYVQTDQAQHNTGV